MIRQDMEENTESQILAEWANYVSSDDEYETCEQEDITKPPDQDFRYNPRQE